MPDSAIAPGCATVVFQPWGRRCQAKLGEDLLTTAQAAGVGVASGCGGVGACGECVVRVAEGSLSDLAAEEYEWLFPKDRSAGLRLACLARVVEPGCTVVVDVPPESRVGDQPSQIDADGIDLPSLVPLTSTSRISSASGASSLSPDSRRLGVAIDLGTTGLATYLVDLARHRVLAAQGSPNPQISYGEDVMARLAVAIADPVRTAAMRTVLSFELNRLVEELCCQAGASRENIVEAMVVGNTAMHHLFFGLPVTTLAWAPYVPADASERTVPAARVGLQLAPGAMVTSPPVVAGFVGSDHVSMLLSAGALTTTDTTAFLDVGTNTEISLVAHGEHWTCSAASGPAFEGAHIAAGMRAAPGAIDRVRWGPEGLTATTIDGAPAVGICGSGLLDAVAVLRQQGAVRRSGGLRSGHRLVTGSGRDAYVALSRPCFERPETGRLIRLNRRDIGEVQLAKAAVRAGLKLLTEAAGIHESAIAEIVLAGAFGSYLDVSSARSIGMLPPTVSGRVRQVGNGAGAGACLLLADKVARADAVALCDRITYVELTGHRDFQDRFTQALMLSDDPWSA